MLEVRGLNVGVWVDGKEKLVVKDVSFSLRERQVVGIVGESGSGKSMTAMAVAGLLPPEVDVWGEIILNNRCLRPGRDEDWQNVRGKELGLVFQDPGACLNPLLPVGKQVAEVLCLHQGISMQAASTTVLSIFKALGIGQPAVRMQQYPHQLSGGMKQRVMMAAAICCNPPLLIADEPTTALDVTVQAQILGLLNRYVREQKTALLIISHDLGVIAQLADRVLVMCAGEIVEEADVAELYASPLHPYTRTLLASVPRLNSPLYVPELPVLNQASRTGCCFADRCMQQNKICLLQKPGRIDVSECQSVWCHYAKMRRTHE